HFLSRSITDARLARRAPEFVAESHRHWRAAHGAEPLEAPLRLPGRTLPGRCVTVEQAGDGSRRPAVGTAGARAVARMPGGDVLELSAEPGAAGGWVHAPDDERGLPAAAARLAGLAAGGAGLVGVHGGTPLTRTLLTEQARMEHGLAALLVDPALDRDRAVTAVLSGRADLVGADAAAVARWTAP
ncbi:MAG TPA: hypothetical protein VEZ42_19095, partial [Pseudonocardia sp.]|nr:hypothetical protein [Pseudonocardia sp.]